MKRIRIIVAAILRGVVLLVPGAAFLWWAWGKVPALFSILAAAGAEAVWLLVFTFVLVAVKAAMDLRKKKAERSA